MMLSSTLGSGMRHTPRLKSMQHNIFRPLQPLPRPRFSFFIQHSPRRCHSTSNGPTATPSRPLITLTICAASGIFVAMNYARDDRLVAYYSKYQNFCREHLGASLSACISPDIDRQSLGRTLSDYFILRSDDLERGRYLPIIGCAFAHVDPIHFLFNMVSLGSMSQAVTWLPRRTVAGLILGSAMSSSCAFLWGERNSQRRTEALGTSGIVSGVFTAGALMFPLATVKIFGLVPTPFIAALGGYVALDTYMMGSEGSTGVAHAGHIGGVAFGAVYSALFLRRTGLGVFRFLKI